jgi:hypothetical protein
VLLGLVGDDDGVVVGADGAVEGLEKEGAETEGEEDGGELPEVGAEDADEEE